MASWNDIETSAAEFAEAARGFLDAHTHKTIATLRRDGSPRISGIEAFFADGELWVGSMPQALKALDLQRDPRFALHSGSDDPPDWKGDAKLSGRAVEIADDAVKRRIFAIHAGKDDGEPAEGVDPVASHLFRLEISDASVVSLGEPADHLVIDVWREGQGVRRIHRT